MDCFLPRMFFVAAGLAMPLFGQRLPTRNLVAVAVLSVTLLAFYLAAARWLPPTNSTDGASQEANRFA
jgi:membrane protein implicated in regulation of membrane protease activity